MVIVQQQQQLLLHDNHFGYRAATCTITDDLSISKIVLVLCVTNFLLSDTN